MEYFNSNECIRCRIPTNNIAMLAPKGQRRYLRIGDSGFLVKTRITHEQRRFTQILWWCRVVHFFHCVLKIDLSKCKKWLYFLLIIKSLWQSNGIYINIIKRSIEETFFCRWEFADKARHSWGLWNFHMNHKFSSL